LINPYYEYKLEADYSVMYISTADIANKDYNGINDNYIESLNMRKMLYLLILMESV